MLSYEFLLNHTLHNKPFLQITSQIKFISLREHCLGKAEHVSDPSSCEFRFDFFLTILLSTMPFFLFSIPSKLNDTHDHSPEWLPPLPHLLTYESRCFLFWMHCDVVSSLNSRPKASQLNLKEIHPSHVLSLSCSSHSPVLGDTGQLFITMLESSLNREINWNTK